MPATFQAMRGALGGSRRNPSVVRYSVEGCETFVGYYDIAPESADGGAILAHVIAASRRPSECCGEAALGYFDLESGSFCEVAKTALWCWQLGARLRWWPGTGRSLAFNGVIGGRPGYYVTAVNGRTELLADRPLFDVNPNGVTAIAINFGRLWRARPGYGYPALDDPFSEEPLPAGDGVTIIDLLRGRAELIATLPEIADLDPRNSRAGFHYLNAASLSPSGRRFSVLYKTLPRSGRTDLWIARAVIGNTDGSDLRMVPLPGMPSHYWWINDHQIAFTSNVAGNAARCRYQLFDLISETLMDLHPAAPSFDGHPSRHRLTGRWLTDSYPNRYGEQDLYILESDGSRRRIASFRASPGYKGEWKCDLHPRWALDGGGAYIDSTHEGFRAIYAVEIPGSA